MAEDRFKGFDDGGPAFPCSNEQLTHGNPATGDASPGMSLRDWIAAQALNSIGTWMPESGGDNLSTWQAMNARAVWAYEQADAMLKARNA